MIKGKTPEPKFFNGRGLYAIIDNKIQSIELHGFGFILDQLNRPQGDDTYTSYYYATIELCNLNPCYHDDIGRSLRENAIKVLEKDIFENTVEAVQELVRRAMPERWEKRYKYEVKEIQL